jgi:hypothetical protein
MRCTGVTVPSYGNFSSKLFQLGVLGLGLPQDGDVRVSVLPEREEIIVGGAGFGGVVYSGAGTTQLSVGQFGIGMGECLNCRLQPEAN